MTATRACQRPRLLREIAPTATGFANFVTAQRSQFGRGGMLTKCHMAHKVAKLGISVHIANGKTADILPAVLAETAAHTWFRPSKTASGKRSGWPTPRTRPRRQCK
ncbi:hypothetical protein ACFQT0_01425 [Hymenobacter humi]|uniref:Uncharacterized protein n=1 Tax=Hymenobacter humi TaxID=1411620 RepID=A0ABW2U2G1_9BACT